MKQIFPDLTRTPGLLDFIQQLIIRQLGGKPGKQDHVIAGKILIVADAKQEDRFDRFAIQRFPFDRVFKVGDGYADPGHTVAFAMGLMLLRQ